MRYAIIESGGKQYKAVEGMAIDVDRLSTEKGKQIDLERILMMADGDDFMIGTPIVSGIQVKATVVDHLRGEKVFRFKYSPKKRIRVRGGHRQQYTRLMVDFIGKPGEKRKVEKAEAEPVEPKTKAEPRARKKSAEAAPEAAVTAAPKAKKAAAKTPATADSKGKKSTDKKASTAKKSSK